MTFKRTNMLCVVEGPCCKQQVYSFYFLVQLVATSYKPKKIRPPAGSSRTVQLEELDFYMAKFTKVLV